MGRLILYRSIVNVAGAILNPAVEVQLFDDGAEVVGALSLTLLRANDLAVGLFDLWCTFGVFYVEDRLLCLDEGGKGLTL